MDKNKRIKQLKDSIDRRQKEADNYFKETEKECGKNHTWAYDEHYQCLIREVSLCIEKLRGYKLGIKDALSKNKDVSKEVIKDEN